MATPSCAQQVQPTWLDGLLKAGELLQNVPLEQLDLTVLIALNTLLVPSTNSFRGLLRTGPAMIRLGGVIFAPMPSADQARELAVGTLRWLAASLKHRSASVPPVALAAETLFRLTDAHPFMDGNGRVARAVATWILLRGGYEIKADPGAYMRDRKSACYGAIAVRQGSAGARDPLPWNTFFNGLATECFIRPALPRVAQKPAMGGLTVAGPVVRASSAPWEDPNLIWCRQLESGAACRERSRSAMSPSACDQV